MYQISHDVDVAIIGGGVAGLAAALLLGRANIPTVVFDRPEILQPQAPSHNFLTNDGRRKSDILEAGRADVARYASVELRDARVSGLAHTGTGYELTLDEDARLNAGGGQYHCP